MMRWKYGLLVAIFGLVLVADQATKFLAVARLTSAFEQAGAKTLGGRVSAYLALENLDNDPARPGGVDHRKAPSVVVENYWQHKYVENPGAAWGLFAKVDESWRRPFFHVVSLIAVVAIVSFYRRLQPGQGFLAVALSLVLGGAIGNYTDRLIDGYVIDFVDWHWRNQPGLHWPTFNVADVAIVVGVSMLMLQTLLARRPAGAPALAPTGEPAAAAEAADPQAPKPDSLAPLADPPPAPQPPPASET
ncbi:MAG: signal peptidase II [Myxococcales bacterium]